MTATALVLHPWLAGNNSSFDASNSEPTSNSSSISKPEGFRLREVDSAKLAQRRKLQKRSTSSSVSSSASTTSRSSNVSIQLLRPPSATTTTASSASPAQPSAFDFREEKVSEYLSSLSSSSDSNSPRAVYHSADRRESRGEPRTKRRKRDVNIDNGKSNVSGPVTRARKRKLEQSESDSSAESSPEPVRTNKRELNIHRKQKTGKRPKRLATIIVE